MHRKELFWSNGEFHFALGRGAYLGCSGLCWLALTTTDSAFFLLSWKVLPFPPNPILMRDSQMAGQHALKLPYRYGEGFVSQSLRQQFACSLSLQLELPAQTWSASILCGMYGKRMMIVMPYPQRLTQREPAHAVPHRTWSMSVGAWPPGQSQKRNVRSLMGL